MPPDKDHDIQEFFQRALDDVQAPAGLDQRVAMLGSQAARPLTAAQRWNRPFAALAVGILFGVLGMQLFGPQPQVIQQLAAPQLSLRGNQADVAVQIELASLSKEEYLRLVTDLVSAGRYEDARRVLDAFDHYFPNQRMAPD